VARPPWAGVFIVTGGSPSLHELQKLYFTQIKPL
jgi:hypothetical protein